jgi:hypothetical protein
MATRNPTRPIPLVCTHCGATIGDALDLRIDQAMANHRCHPRPWTRLRLRWPLVLR